MSRQRFHLLRFFFLSFSALCACGSLHANMGDPLRPGDPVGEPSPLLDSIHVLHEQLTIDLRPAAQRNPCVVQATYRLRNDGAQKDLELMFVAGGLARMARDSTRDFSVQIDGLPVAGRFSDSLPLPLRWNLPAYTPGLESDSLLYEIHSSFTPRFRYNSEAWVPENTGEFAPNTPVILFSLALPSGEHTVTVTYKAELAGYPNEADFYTWQLGYVLSPARRWGGFGKLDAQILVPEGWEAATWPEMKRRGDTLFGSWNGLPADAIAISTRLSVSPILYALVQALPILAAFILAVLLTFRMGWKKGQQLVADGRRKKRSLWSVIPTGMLSTLLTFMMVGGGIIGAAAWKHSLLQGQEVPGYGVGMFFFIFFLYPPFWVILLIPSPVSIIGSVMGRRRALQEYPSTPTEDLEPKEEI